MSLPVRGGTSTRYDREPGRVYDERDSHRNQAHIGSRYGGDDIGHHGSSGIRDRSYHQRERLPPSPPFSKTAFGNALQQLYTTLRSSIRFFREFEEGYLDETHAIQPYATPRIMKELWVFKAMNSDQDPSRISQRRLLDDSNNGAKFDRQDRSSSPPRGGKFRDHIQYIKEDFENALNSGPPRPHQKQHYRESRVGSIGGGRSVASSRLDAESTERLMGKLAGQYKILGKILCNIYKVRSYVQEFIKESELLASYLDKSRNLWQLEEQVRSRQRQRQFQQREAEQEPQSQEDRQGYQSDGQAHDYQEDRDNTPFEDSSQGQADEW